MPIDDILRERGAYPESQTQQQSQQNTQSTSASTGSITLEIPDPMSGDRDALIFWMQVVQTVALLYLAWKLG